MGSIINKTNKTPDKHSVVKIGWYHEKYVGTIKVLDYNVSNFLNDYDKMGSKCHNKMDNFIENLDKKVKIDINNEIHKSILDGIYDITRTICTKLPKCDESYSGITQCMCGSMYAGLRVGRHYVPIFY